MTSAHHEDHTELIDITDIDADLSDKKNSPTSPQYSLQSSTNKLVQTRYASLGERFSALLLDIVLIYILYWPCMLIYRSIAMDTLYGPIPLKYPHGALFHSLFGLIICLYFILSEYVLHGTIGKRLCGLRIYSKYTSDIAFTSILLRNIARLIDIALAPLIIPIWALERNDTHMRLGDLLAGTVVIKQSPTYAQRSISMELIASTSKRLIAALIDSMLFISFTAGYLLLLTHKMPLSSMLLLVYIPVVGFTYPIILETFSQTTPGKWICGLRICHENGQSLTLSASIIRTLYRIIDSNPLGLLSILTSIRHQRPGDVAANTVIIKSSRQSKGLVSCIIACLLAGAFLYAGFKNEDNFLSSSFRINFLPTTSTTTRAKPSKINRPLSLNEFYFTNSRSKSDRTGQYQAKDSVSISFHIANYHIVNRSVDIAVDLGIGLPNGDMALSMKNFAQFSGNVKSRGPIEFNKYSFNLPENTPAGRYSIELTIHDRILKKTITKRRFFTVTPNQRERMLNQAKAVNNALPASQKTPKKTKPKTVHIRIDGDDDTDQKNQDIKEFGPIIIDKIDKRRTFY